MFVSNFSSGSAAAAVCLLTTVLATPAAAAERTTEGYVVRIADGEVVVDVGEANGIPPNAELQVFRRLVVQHPVTGKSITDRFPIGTIRLDQVGEKLSLTRQLRGLSQPLSVGDYVVYNAPTAVKPVEKPPQPVDKPESTSAAARADDVQALEVAFLATLGRSIYDRIDIWQAWLRQYPSSDFADEVGNEVHWLRVALTEQQANDEPGVATAAIEAAPEKADASSLAPRRILEGAPLQVDVVSGRPELVDTVRVHYRRRGAPTFETAELTRDGDFNWRGTLPAAMTAEPGAVEHFVDTVRHDGQLEKGETIRTTDVEPRPNDPARRTDRSRANLLYEFVDFRVASGDDHFHRFEAEYRYAIGTYLNGFTVGAGLFRGSGASLDELAAGEPSRSLNLSYAYAEADFEFFRYVGISGRLLVGNRQQLGVQGSVLRDAFGGNLKLRFGDEDSTRLEVGGAATRAVGSEAWINLFVDAIDRVPMSGEVVVTNLPVGENLGVSLNYGVGWQFTDLVTVMARVGWNARTIYDYGFSAGLNTQLEW